MTSAYGLGLTRAVCPSASCSVACTWSHPRTFHILPVLSSTRSLGSASTHRVSVFFSESIQSPAGLVQRVPEVDVVVPVGVGRLALVFELFAECGVVGRDLLRHPGFVGNLRLEAIDLVGKVAVKRLREVELVVAP